MADGGTVLADGAWTIHNRPRAVYADGSTFIGSITRSGRIQISEYYHDTGAIETTTLGVVFADDHSSPSLYLRDDGHIIVFWSDRSGDPDRDEMRWRISDDPYDISSFGDLHDYQADGAVNYPQPLEWDGNLRIYHREGGVGAPWVWRESTDGGESFESDSNELIDAGGAIYVHPFADGNRLHFAIGDHRMSQPSIRHWYLEDGDYYESDGTHIQSADNPINDEDGLTIVYDGEATGNNPSKQYDLISVNGEPHVVFTEHVETGDGGGDGDYRARWAKWDSDSDGWTVGSEITEMGGALPERHYYESGLGLDSQDPSTVYVAVETDDRNYQVQEWTTDDDGSTWTKVEDLSPDGSEPIDPTKRTRPISPRNHNDEMSVLWFGGHYNHFEEFNTQIRKPFGHS